MAALDARTVTVHVVPDFASVEAKCVGVAMITLTHPQGDGPAECRKYSGRVFVDANRIQLIEEILVEGEQPVSFLTLHDGVAIRVSETPEQITTQMAEALNVPAATFS
jgi:hypothetical protein